MANHETKLTHAFLNQYLLWAQSLCAPVFWRNKEGVMHSGSVTFLRTKSEILGVTNAHVADGLMADCDKSANGCQIGGAYLDTSRFIARHKNMDLATFRLSDVFLGPAGHHAATVLTWPPTPPSEGDVVAFGGWPKIYREENHGSVDFTFTLFSGKVHSVSDRNIGMILDIAKSKSFSSDRVHPNADLGGWSGGPLFRVIENNNIERFELSAIIYEYSSNYELVLAHPLTDLHDDGYFVD